jgi:hypothetical protein
MKRRRFMLTGVLSVAHPQRLARAYTYDAFAMDVKALSLDRKAILG